MNVNAEILMNVTPTETRVGVVENGVLQEIFIERENHRGLVGNIYKGKVVRVSPPGMEVLLIEQNVSAFLPTRTMGDRGTVKGATLQVRRGRNVRSFTEGHPIAVKLVDVDFIRLQLMLELA